MTRFAGFIAAQMRAARARRVQWLDRRARSKPPQASIADSFCSASRHPTPRLLTRMLSYIQEGVSLAAGQRLGQR
jgi:hypothetical protein